MGWERSFGLSITPRRLHHLLGTDTGHLQPLQATVAEEEFESLHGSLAASLGAVRSDEMHLEILC